MSEWCCRRSTRFSQRARNLGFIRLVFSSYARRNEGEQHATALAQVFQPCSFTVFLKSEGDIPNHFRKALENAVGSA